MPKGIYVRTEKTKLNMKVYLTNRNKSNKQKMLVSNSWKNSDTRKSRIENISKSLTGKKLSKEHILKLYGRKKNIGKNHWNWKGGINPVNDTIRKSIEFRLWREAVFARDNWTCQKYKTVGEKLHSHHIQNFAKYPELRFAIDNGITLSKKAHNEFHKKYGIKNNTLEQITEFLSYV